MAQITLTQDGVFTKQTMDALNTMLTELYASSQGGNVSGPVSSVAGQVATFGDTTGKVLAANTTGVTAGPFTTVASIQVVKGLVTVLTGS